MSRSSVWVQVQDKYIRCHQTENKTMELSYVYGYVSFGLVLLLLLGLIRFTWMALCKIRGCPVL
jgi:hypothetical protein